MDSLPLSHFRSLQESLSVRSDQIQAPALAREWSDLRRLAEDKSHEAAVLGQPIAACGLRSRLEPGLCSRLETALCSTGSRPLSVAQVVEEANLAKAEALRRASLVEAHASKVAFPH
eukprot:1184540-Prorocentrum_minimum.AAC.3